MPLIKIMIKHGVVFYVMAAGAVFSNTAKAQIKLKSFFVEVKHFVSAAYSGRNLRAIEKWSDSSYTVRDRKKGIKQWWCRGVLKTKENVRIDFEFFASGFTLTGDKKCNGTILISHEGDCNAVALGTVLVYIPEYSMSFDSVGVSGGAICSINKIRLHFDNYNPPVNLVLQTVDTSITALLKHEYFDFYFMDIDERTSKWQSEFKTFMQPHSDALVVLIKKGNIKGVFDLMGLKNKGYSWSLAEGLWYYNTLHPVLTSEQLGIVDSYNGKGTMISFRSKEELKAVYQF